MNKRKNIGQIKNKIYTKKGDKGETGTFLGRISKSDQLAVSLGTIDELNSWIGVLRISPSPFGYPPLNLRGGTQGGDILKNIQTNLMTINSTLAGSKVQRFPARNASHSDAVGIGAETVRLEKLIDKLQAELPELKNFIYPVGYLQVARAVCRRAEREMVLYLGSEVQRFKGSKQILKYIN